MILTLSTLLLACTTAFAASVTGPGDFDGPEHVTFYLYTQNNPETPEIIIFGDEASGGSFNPKHPTRFVLHGAHTNYLMYLDVKDAYLGTGKDYNVVMIDWSGVAALEEMVAMETTWKAGDYIGSVIDDLIEGRGLDPDDVYIVGHSMGGQLAGIVGNRVGNGSVAEVVGLDPASDIYDDNPPENQLDASDAQFVQIIHTNGPGLGIPDPRGTVDFIVNNGSYQPGCEGWTGPGQPEGRSPEGDDGCSHERVVDLYIESISSHELVGTVCDGYDDFLEGECDKNAHAVLGEDTPKDISGVYYLITNSESPYGVGDPDDGDDDDCDDDEDCDDDDDECDDDDDDEDCDDDDDECDDDEDCDDDDDDNECNEDEEDCGGAASHLEISALLVISCLSALLY